MNLFEFNPVAMWESGKNAGLEREEINAFVSAAYSAWLAFMWRSGSSKWALWSGESKALQDAATAAYLSLEALQAKGFLVLTVSSDMLDAVNVSKFQTSFKAK